MKYKENDIVLAKCKISDIDNHPTEELVYEVEFPSGGSVWVAENEIVDSKTYTQGLADAWELAKKILEMCGEKREEILGLGSYANILEFVAPEEALAKIEAYEREKEIKVGDEVVHGATEAKDVFVVTSIGNGMIRGVKKNGVTNSFTFPNPYIQKTGKHIDIESLLRQIGE